MVEPLICTGNGHLPALTISAGVSDRVQAGRQDHGLVRRMAESEDENRGGQRGEVPAECPEGPRRVRGGAGDESEGIWGAARRAAAAAEGEADGVKQLRKERYFAWLAAHLRGGFYRA